MHPRILERATVLVEVGFGIVKMGHTLPMQRGLWQLQCLRNATQVPPQQWGLLVPKSRRSSSQVERAEGLDEFPLWKFRRYFSDHQLKPTLHDVDGLVHDGVALCLLQAQCADLAPGIAIRVVMMSSRMALIFGANLAHAGTCTQTCAHI